MPTRFSGLQRVDNWPMLYFWRSAMQRYQTEVNFVCPNCGSRTTSQVGIPEPDWGQVQRGAYPNSEGSTVIPSYECQTLFPANAVSGPEGTKISLNLQPSLQPRRGLNFRITYQN